MIKIAICDDNISTLDSMYNLIDKYGKGHGLSVDCQKFHSPLDLIAEIERGAKYDVLFMDVLMPGENGIDTATEIRNYDSTVKIIFLSSSSDFAVQSYSVGAYYYQLKPVSQDIFFKLMDSVLSACEQEKSNSLILRCKSGITRIEFKRLEYCEVIHRTLFFHLSDGNILESIGSMDDLYSRLADKGVFLRPHRSYLVNMDYIRTMSYKSIVMMCGDEIPLPRGKYSELKNCFMEYSFKNHYPVF